MENAKVAEIIERFGKEVELSRAKNPELSERDALLMIAQENCMELARALRDDIDLSPTEIARVLYYTNGLNLRAEEVIKVLHSEEGLNLGAEKVASIMCDLIRDYDDPTRPDLQRIAVALMKSLRVNDIEVSRILTSKDGPQLSAKDIFYVLHALDRDIETIVCALHDGVGLSPSETARLICCKTNIGVDEYEVANLLYSKEGLDLTKEKVARALYDEDGLNLPISKVAKVLFSKDGVDLNEFQIASALYRKDGLGLSAADVARALHDREGLGLSVTKVANTLYFAEGVNLPATEIARALHSKDGLGLPASEVARVLFSQDGLDLHIGEAAYALYSKEGLGLSAAEVARVLRDSGVSAEKIALALRSVYATNALLDRSAHDGSANLPAAQFAAAAMYSEEGLGLPATEIVRVLYSMRGFGLPTEKVVAALKDGLSLPAHEIVYALRSQEGLGLPESEITQALDANGFDLSVDEIAEVAAALERAHIASSVMRMRG